MIEIKEVGSSDMVEFLSQWLQLDPHDAEAPEGARISAMVRRLVAIRPAGTVASLRSDLNSLLSNAGLATIDSEAFGDLVQDLVAYGDLLPATSSDGKEVLHRAEPAFVVRPSGHGLLLGIEEPGSPPLPQQVLASIEVQGHCRVLRNAVTHREALRESGYFEVRLEEWLAAPRIESAAAVVADAVRRLDRSPEERNATDLVIIDPMAPVTFYAGRKREPSTSDSGYFVARRPRLYGAEAWAFVELLDGQVRRLVDIEPRGRWRSCEMAWYLQAALDAEHGRPQLLGIHRDYKPGAVLFEVYSPIPSWVERRWRSVGVRVSRRGCLFAYELQSVEADAEVDYALQAMFLKLREEG